MHTPDFDAIAKEYSMLSKIFKQLTNPKECLTVLKRRDEILDQFAEWSHLQTKNFSKQTNSDRTKDGLALMQSWAPRIKTWDRRFIRAVLNSSVRSELEKVLGKHIFEVWTLSLKCHSKKIEDDCIKEAQLCTQYQVLLSSAEVEYKKENIPLNDLIQHMQSAYRNIREDAMTAYWSWFEDNATELDAIFDELVQTRHNMALKLGWKNFTELGYARLKRTEYSPTEIGHFRNYIREYLTPITQEISERQRQVLSLDEIMAWDESIYSIKGNPIPVGDKKWLLERSEEMLSKVSPRIGHLFQLLNEGKQIDIDNHPHKSNQKINVMNSDSDFYLSFKSSKSHHDVGNLLKGVSDILQQRSTRSLPHRAHRRTLPDLRAIIKNTLVILCLPHMEFLFGEDAEQYRWTYLLQQISSISEGTTADHFQNLVYSKPQATAYERNAMWNRVEGLYQPNKNWGDINHPARGAAWHAQASIFVSPFSEIGNSLAIPCALQFYITHQENPLRAMTRFEFLCEEGGKSNYTNNLNSIKSISPLKTESLNITIGDIKRLAFSMME